MGICVANVLIKTTSSKVFSACVGNISQSFTVWEKNHKFRWCVYKQPIRTNNDLEGWHNALNRRAGGQCGLPLYLLIELLDREAKLTTVTIRLVSDNKLKRIQRKVTRNIQAKLFSSWEKYENNEKTAAQLLKICSRLNGPARAN